MKHKISLLVASVAGTAALVNVCAYAGTGNVAKTGSAPVQAKPAVQGPAPAPAAEKVQLIVEVGATEPNDAVQDALNEAHGRIVKIVNADEIKYYLIEIDKKDYSESYKKLSKDKKFKSVQLNRSYKLH